MGSSEVLFLFAVSLVHSFSMPLSKLLPRMAYEGVRNAVISAQWNLLCHKAKDSSAFSRVNICHLLNLK